MGKKYTFEYDFSSAIEDLWQTAICKDLNDAQYKLFLSQRDEIIKKFNSVINECEKCAEQNSIVGQETDLKDTVKLLELKSLSDLEALIKFDDTRCFDGPGDYAGHMGLVENRDFCKRFPDIAKKYLKLE